MINVNNSVHGALARTHPLLPTVRVQINHSLLSVCRLTPAVLAVSKNCHSAAEMHPRRVASPKLEVMLFES